MTVRYSRFLFLSLFLFVLTVVFSGFSGPLPVVLKCLFIFLLPGIILAGVFKKQKIRLIEFLLISFPVSLVYIIFVTIFIKICWMPLQAYKVYIISSICLPSVLLYSSRLRRETIEISKSDLKMLFLGLAFIFLFILSFHSYLFVPLENIGFKKYSNDVDVPIKGITAEGYYHFGGQWKREGDLYSLEKGMKGRISLKRVPAKKKYIAVRLGFKGDIGGNVMVKWNNYPLGSFNLSSRGLKPFTDLYKKYSGKSVIFLYLIMKNEARENFLEIEPSGSGVVCETYGRAYHPPQLIYAPRMVDIIEVYVNSELFLKSNRYVALQPPLGYYFNAMGFLFFDKDLKSISFMSIGIIFLVFLAVLLLAGNENFSLLAGAACFFPLLIYLKTYATSLSFMFGDAMYTLHFLLFIYFLIKRKYACSGLNLFFMSIIRFPGIFLALSYLFLYLYMYKIRVPEEAKRVRDIFILSLLGIMMFNVAYPVSLHGWARWLQALYSENFNPEHFGVNYTFTPAYFFRFIGGIFYFTFFLPLLLIFKRNKLSCFMLLGIVPYVLILASVRCPQIHYMFPIICIMLASGVRSLRQFRLPSWMD